MNSPAQTQWRYTLLGFVAVLLILLRLKPRPFIALGIAAAAGGMFLAVTHQSNVSPGAFFRNWAANPAAYFLALAIAMIWGLFSALSRKLGGDKGSSAPPPETRSSPVPTFPACQTAASVYAPAS